MNGCTAMVFTAHPDDEIFCSGSIARLTQTGNKVILVVATDGEKGSHDPSLTPAAITAQRREELDRAAARLGVEEVRYLGYKDGELQFAADLKETLFRVVRTYKPDIALTFDPWKRYEIHSDHRSIGFASIEAAHLGANCWYYEEQLSREVVCHKVKELYLFNPDEPNYHVDITATFSQKLSAATAHASQFGNDPVDEAKLRQIINQPNPNYQIRLEPMRKMYSSSLFI